MFLTVYHGKIDNVGSIPHVTRQIILEKDRFAVFDNELESNLDEDSKSKNNISNKFPFMRFFDHK